MRKIFVIVCVVFTVVWVCMELGVNKTLLASPSMPYLRITVGMLVAPLAALWALRGMRK